MIIEQEWIILCHNDSDSVFIYPPSCCSRWLFVSFESFFLLRVYTDSLWSPTCFSTVMDVPCLLCLCTQVMVGRLWPDRLGLYSVGFSRHVRDCSLMPSLSIPPAMDGHSFSHSDGPQLDAGGFVLPPPMVTQIFNLASCVRVWKWTHQSQTGNLGSNLQPFSYQPGLLTTTLHHPLRIRSEIGCGKTMLSYCKYS